MPKGAYSNEENRALLEKYGLAGDSQPSAPAAPENAGPDLSAFGSYLDKLRAGISGRQLGAQKSGIGGYAQRLKTSADDMVGALGSVSQEQSAPRGVYSGDENRRLLAKYGLADYSPEEQFELNRWNQKIGRGAKNLQGYQDQLGAEGWQGWQGDSKYRGQLKQQIQEAEGYLRTLKPGSITYQDASDYLDYLRGLDKGFQSREDFYGQFSNETEWKAAEAAWKGLQDNKKNGKTNADYAAEADADYAEKLKAFESYGTDESYDAGAQGFTYGVDNSRGQKGGRPAGIDDLDAYIEELEYGIEYGVGRKDGWMVALTDEDIEQYEQELQRVQNYRNGMVKSEQQKQDQARQKALYAQYVKMYADAAKYADLPQRADWNRGVYEGREKFAGRGENDIYTPNPLASDPLAMAVDQWISKRENDKMDTPEFEPADNWTKEQINTFYYLYNRSTEEAANYAFDINNAYNQQSLAEKQGILREWTNKNGWTRAAAWGANVFSGPFALGDYIGSATQYAAMGRTMSRDYVTPADAADNMMSAASEYLNKKGTIGEDVPIIGGKGLGDLYQWTNSLAKSAATAYMGGGMTNLLFFGDAANQGFKRAKERGATDEQALTLGFWNGAAEVLGETLSVEHLIRIKSPGGFKRTFMNVLTQAGIEGSEEGFTTLINTMADAWVMGDKSELNTKIREYRLQGMSKEEAERKAFGEWWNDLGFDMLSGALSGGVSAAGKMGGHNFIGSVTKYQGDAQGLIDVANLTDEGTDARKYAAMYQQKLDSGKKLTNRQAEILQMTTQEEINATDRPKLIQAVEDRLHEARFAERSDKEISRMAEKIVDRIQTGEVKGRWSDLEQTIYKEMQQQLAGEKSGAGNWLKTDGLKITQSREMATQRLKTVELKDSGKRAQVKSTKMENGKMVYTVEENGKKREVTQKDLKLDEYQTKALGIMTKILGEDAAAAFNGMTLGNMRKQSSAYSGTWNIMEYANAFATIRDLFGAKGTAETREAREKAALASPLRNVLTDEQVMQAFAIGEKRGTPARDYSTGDKRGTGKISMDDITVKTKDGDVTFKGIKDQKAAKKDPRYKILETLGKELGIDFYLYDGTESNYNGGYQNGVVYLDWTARDTDTMTAEDLAGWVVFQTLSHELTHFIEHNAKEEYAELKSFIIDYLSESKNLDFNELVTDKVHREYNPMTGRVLSRTEAEAEVIADACQTMLQNSKYVEKLLNEHRTLWDKIRDFIKSFFGKIEAKDEGAKELEAVRDQVQELWDRALMSAVEGRVSEETLSDIPTVEEMQQAAPETVRTVFPQDMVDAILKKDPNSMSRSERKVYDLFQQAQTVRNAALPQQRLALPAHQEQQQEQAKPKRQKLTPEQKKENARTKRRFNKAVEELMEVASWDRQYLTREEAEKMVMDYAATHDGYFSMVDEAKEKGTYKTRNQYSESVYEDRYSEEEVDRSDWPTEFEFSTKDGQSRFDKELGIAELDNKQGQGVAIANLATGQAQFSIKTYNEGGKRALREFLDQQVEKKALTEKEAGEIRTQMDELYKVCKSYDNGRFAPFSAWSNATVVTYDGRPVFSVVKANGEYKLNLDFSLVCKKRRTLDAVFNYMIKSGVLDNFDLGQESIAKINDIIRENGFETACGLCFVDAKRYRQGIVSMMFTKMYNQQVRSLVKKDSGQKLDYFNYGGNDFIKDSGAGIDTLDDSELDWTTIDKILRTEKKSTVKWKIADYLKNNPSARRLVMRGDFMSTAGFDAVKAKNPELLKLYNSKKGAGGPKAAQSDVQYLNEIIEQSNFNEKAAYEVGGVRIQSFSDYVGRLVFDYVQMIGDLSAKKLPAHSYTKEFMYALQFGLTGVKINMSLVPEIIKDGVAPGLDANGNYAWKDGQSFGSTVYDNRGKRMTAAEGFELAKRIQNADGYSKNCGTIAVGVSDAHILKMLNDPEIRMIIPYHKSSLNHIVASMMNIDRYEDYTLQQNTREYKNGKWVNISKEKEFNFNEALQRLGDAKAAANEYLDWCKKNGYKPKFDGTKGGHNFSEHENYYKLLEDFSCYDRDGTTNAPLSAVQMKFPGAADAFGSMSELIEQGLDEDAILQAKQDAAVPKIVEEIKTVLPDFEADVRERGKNGKKKAAVVDGSSMQFSTKAEVLAREDISWADDFSSIKDQLKEHRVEIETAFNKQPLVNVEYGGERDADLDALILEQALLAGEPSEDGLSAFFDRDGITFDFDESGARSIRSHASANEGLRAAALAAPHILKNGIRIAGQKNHEHTGITTLTYAGPALINNTPVNVGVVVQFQDDGKPRAVNVETSEGGKFVIKREGAAKRNRGRVDESPGTTPPRRATSSVVTIPQYTEESKGKFQASTKNLGYHAGDLGKAEHLNIQGRYRGTGHFGTGTYFVGVEEKVTKDSHYGKRPQHAVDFTDYNLYKVRSDKTGYQLHDALRIIDGGIKREWIRPAMDNQFNIINPTGYYDLAKSKYGEDWAHGDNLLNAMLEYAADNGISVKTLDEYKADEGFAPDDADAAYYYEDYVKDTVKEEIGKVNAEYREFANMVFDLHILPGFTNGKIFSALNAVADYQDVTSRNARVDSYATVFMKNMGYEGIDVRGTRLDNTEYGSVIYDVKPETVQYSVKYDGKSDRQLLEEAETTGLSESEQKALQQYKSLATVYHQREQDVSKALDEFTKLVTAEEPDADAIRKQRNKVTQAEKKMVEALSKLTAAQNGSELRQILRAEREIQRKRTRTKARESVERRELRQKIDKMWKDLNARITNPSEKKRIPVELMQQTIEVLQALNMDTTKEGSERGQKLREKLSALKQRYTELQNDPDFKKAAVYDAQVAQFLDNMIAEVGDTPINRMSNSQLAAVYNTLKALDYTARKALKLQLGEQERDAYDVSKSMTEETRSIAGKMKGAVQTWINAQLSPERMFNRMGGYRKGSTWNQVYNMLNDGQLKQTQLQMEGSMIFDDLLQGKNYEHFIDPKITVDVGLKDEHGNTVRITHGMMVSLYMHLMNEQSARHVAYGGLTIPGLKDYYNGKKVRGQESSVRVGGVLQETADLRDQLRETEDEAEQADLQAQIDELTVQAMDYVQELRESIEKKLTDYDRQWIAACRELFDGWSKDVLNQTTLDVYGIKRANVDNYFPIWVDGDFLNTPFETIAKDLSLENAGFMKERIDSSKPIRLADVSDVAASQVRKVSQYCGMMPVIRDFNKIWGKTQTGYRDSLQKAVRETFGNSGVNYIEHLMADLNGARRQQETALGEMLNRMRGRMAQASLTLSLRTAMGQAASYPTAASVLGWKALHKALWHGGRNNRMISRADQELIRKWSPLLYYRMKGYSNTELGDIAGMNDKFTRVWNKARWATGWIQAVDGATVGRLWYAAEYYVQDHNKSLRKGTDAYYEEVAKKFNEAIEKTQPNYTTMQRPDILRNPNALVKQLTMFLTQRLQNFNILFDACATYSQMKADLKAGRNGVTAADVHEAAVSTRTAAISQLAAGATIAAFKFLADLLLHSVKAYRDDDEELTAESVSRELLDMFLDSLAGNVLGGSEVYDLVESRVFGKTYYGIEVSSVSTVTDLIKALNTTYDNVASGKASLKDLQSFAKKFGPVLGIPVANAAKILDGCYYWIQDARSGVLLDSDADRSTKQQAHRLYRAYLDMDYSKVNRIREEVPEDSQDDLDSAVRAYIKQEYKDGNVNFFDALRQFQKYGNANDQFMQTFIKDAYAEGKINQKETLRQLQKYGNASEQMMQNFIKDAFAEGKISQKEAERQLVEFGGMTAEKAEKAMISASGKKETGVSYDEIDDNFRLDLMTADETRKALIAYGLDKDTADMKVEYWSYQKKYPGTSFTSESFKTYYYKFKPLGMDAKMYEDFKIGWDAVPGVDKNHDGRADSGSKKKDRIKLINSLPLTKEQKNELYNMHWKTGLDKAPWNKR